MLWLYQFYGRVNSYSWRWIHYLNMWIGKHKRYWQHSYAMTNVCCLNMWNLFCMKTGGFSLILRSMYISLHSFCAVWILWKTQNLFEDMWSQYNLFLKYDNLLWKQNRHNRIKSDWFSIVSKQLENWYRNRGTGLITRYFRPLKRIHSIVKEFKAKTPK